MYNEDMGGSQRTAWRYQYTGRALLPHARKKYEEYQVKETAARDKMAVMVKNPATFHDDRDLQKVKADIDRLSAVREQLEVHLVEFQRSPEQAHSLHLSDIVFFGIHLSDSFEGLREVEAAWEHVYELRRTRAGVESEVKTIQDSQERYARQLEFIDTEGKEDELRLTYIEELRLLHGRLKENRERLQGLDKEITEADKAASKKQNDLSIPTFVLPDISAAQNSPD